MQIKYANMCKFGMQTGIINSNGQEKQSRFIFTLRKKIVWPNNQIFNMRFCCRCCCLFVFFVIVHKLLSYVSIVYPKLKPVPIVTVNRTSQHFDSEPAWFWSIQVQHTCTSYRIVSNHITYVLYKHCFHFFLPICFARIRFA